MSSRNIYLDFSLLLEAPGGAPLGPILVGSTTPARGRLFGPPDPWRGPSETADYLGAHEAHPNQAPEGGRQAHEQLTFGISSPEALCRHRLGGSRIRLLGPLRHESEGRGLGRAAREQIRRLLAVAAPEATGRRPRIRKLLKGPWSSSKHEVNPTPWAQAGSGGGNFSLLQRAAAFLVPGVSGSAVIEADWPFL